MNTKLESKRLFFKRKNQKTFTYKVFALRQRLPQIARSFCFFFKKKRFLGNEKWEGASLPPPTAMDAISSSSQPEQAVR